MNKTTIKIKNTSPKVTEKMAKKTKKANPHPMNATQIKSEIRSNHKKYLDSVKASKDYLRKHRHDKKLVKFKPLIRYDYLKKAGVLYEQYSKQGGKVPLNKIIKGDDPKINF